jgi:peptidyl-prolyl cis-trans isomerase C
MSALCRFRWCFAVIALGGALGCGADGDTIARVGSRQLEIAPFQDYVSEVTGEGWQGVGADVTSRLLDQYLDRLVVLETARRRDVSSVSDPLALGPADMQWLLDELCGPPPAPDEAEVADGVARRMEVVRPAQVHVRQVLVDSYEEALAARQRLAAGEDFVEVSREVSRAPNAADGGELGFFDQGSLTPEIDEVVFSLEAGAFSDPVQGPSGYHVFQVLEVVPPGFPDRGNVEVAVRAEFSQRQAREFVRDCILGLAAETGVEVHDELLWFSYSGRYAEDHGDAN